MSDEPDLHQAMCQASESQRRWAVSLSLGVGIILLFIKMVAYLMTGSAAIFSDFLESIVHVVATGLVWWAMRVALTPPDKEHPYGHGKAEFFSVGFEGALVFMAGGGILWHTVENLFSESGIIQEALGIGMVLVALVAVVNLALGLYLRFIGKKHDSPLLVADSQHVLSDVWTTGGILVGVGLVYLTGWAWIDSLVAVLVAAHLMWTAIKMMRSAFASLMDETDLDTIARIVEVLNRIREPQWYDVHNLRLRRMGDRVYVDFHLTIPGEWTVLHGHGVMDRIEAAIMNELSSRGAVLIHLDCVKGGEPEGPFTFDTTTRMKPGNFER